MIHSNILFEVDEAQRPKYIEMGDDTTIDNAIPLTEANAVPDKAEAVTKAKPSEPSAEPLVEEDKMAEEVPAAAPAEVSAEHEGQKDAPWLIFPLRGCKKGAGALGAFF